MTEKQCTKCGETKAVSEFNSDKHHPSGYCSHCKACRAAYAKAYHQLPHIKERKRAYDMAYRGRPGVRERQRKNARQWIKTKKGKALKYKHYLIHRGRHPEKWAAYWQVWHAVKTGKLVRPDACSLCGAACKPEGHHRDYTKQLDVDWLCPECHGKVTRGEIALPPKGTT